LLERRPRRHRAPLLTAALIRGPFERRILPDTQRHDGFTRLEIFRRPVREVTQLSRASESIRFWSAGVRSVIAHIPFGCANLRSSMQYEF
jgi:hypothetical protein